MDSNWVSGDEREKLYNEVWNEPLSIVAKKYQISDTSLRKHCKKLGIPMPPRGYWEKLRSGQKIQKTALPKVYGEVKKHVHNYVIKYKTDLKELTDTELMMEEELNLLSNETKKYIKETLSNIEVKKQLRDPCNLITNHSEEIIYRKKRDKELKSASFNTNYYASVKSKFRDNIPILPIYVSESNIKRVYRIIDTIIKTIDNMEGSTRVEINKGKDSGYFLIMHTAFYFEFREEVTKNRNSKDRSEGQEVLLLSLLAKSWFNEDIIKRIEYKDTKDEPLENQIGKIIYEMFVVANRFIASDELKDRELEREWEEEKRKQNLEKMRNGELKEIKLLEQVATDWEKAEKIRRFAGSMKVKLDEITNEEKKGKLLKWLKWALDKADWIDPLTAKEDELLGKNKNIFQIIDEVEFKL